VDKRIQNFTDFLKSNKVNEGDGFGTFPFLLMKDGDIYNYLFQLELENGEQKGFMLVVGKYSQYESMEGPKNSYAVMNINEISPEVIEDIAIKKSDVPDLNDQKFKLADNNLSRFLEQISKALMNYLEKNPKVVRIFDEMQDNMDIENYEDMVKSVLLSFLGPEWSMQEGSHKGTFIFSR
jgi:uncharacterized protein with NRDE domain